jgi:hypothetical protein
MPNVESVARPPFLSYHGHSPRRVSVPAFSVTAVAFFLALLITASPALADHEEIWNYIVWPIIAVLQCFLLIFVVLLAPSRLMRAIVVLLFLLAAAAVEFQLWLESPLTGSMLADQALPVLLGLAVAVPARLKRAS